MAFSFQELLEQFLTARRAYEFETVEFVARRHNDDLVPGLDRLLSQIASSYGYFTALSFETQGINDNGSDVTVRFRDLGSDPDALHRVLGFQIKSHTELLDKGIVSTIKAQRDDAFRKIPDLAHYYIVLCADEVTLKKRLNAVRAEFINADRTTVISPVQALRFYHYEPFHIDGQVKRLVDEKDVVLREFQAALVDIPTDTAKALVCFLTAILLSDGTPSVTVRDVLHGPLGVVYGRLIEAAIAQEKRLVVARGTADELYDLEGDVFDDQGAHDVATLIIPSLDADTALAIDIAHIEGDFSQQSHDGEYLSLMVKSVTPIIAVAAEAIVRYDYSLNDLIPYLLDVAGLDI